MTLIRRVARPMMASVFVWGGVQALRSPDQHVRTAQPVSGQLSDLADKNADKLPVNPNEKQLVQINGATQVVAGLALATGRFPRVAALLLAGSLAPTTAAGHRFWEESDSAARSAQINHFLKNVSMFGGLLIAAADTEGKPGLAWRTSHAVDSARKQGKALRKQAKAQAKLAAKTVTP